MSVKDLGDFDFGFSAVSEEELKQREEEVVSAKTAEIEQVAKTYEEKLNTLYKMIKPLLANLAKDSDKDYIYWPNRQKKVKEFISKVEALMSE